MLVALLCAFCNKFLGICQILGSQLTLHIYQTLNKWLVLLELLVVTLGNRTANDKRCTGIIDKHRVDLIDNSIVVHTLNQILRVLRHVITQIVETELIVGSEGNICHISLTTSFAVGLVLIDTVNT